MCLYSKVLKNPKYGYSKKNRGIVPVLKDERVGYIAGGCGRCMECLKQKGNGWRVRLMEDIKDYSGAKFVTLTFSEEGLEELRRAVNNGGRKLDGYDLENASAVLGVRRFTKRWIKSEGKSPRHWLVTELGEKNGRIHLHGIIYGDGDLIEQKWAQYGFVHIGKFVTDISINYITKYITKVDLKHKGYTPKICTSAGIGKGYVERNKVKHEFKGDSTRTDYRLRNGSKLGLPRYWREKLWTEDEREMLWIVMLDKEVRYIDGVKLEKKYDKEDEWETELRKIGQMRSSRLGYGDDKKNWNSRSYRNDRQRLNKREKVNKSLL